MLPDAHPLRRFAVLLLAVSLAAALLALYVSPRADTRATARLDGAAGVVRGEEPVRRVVEYAWPARFHEDEVATVVVRFRDPACTAKAGAAAQGSAAVELPDSEVTVALVPTGFGVETREKRILLRSCDQSLAWDVVPLRAAEHVLAFRFETAMGTATVSPARFEVPVTGSLLLPSWLLFRGAAAFSMISGVLGAGGTLLKLQRWAGKIREKLRGTPQA